MFRYVAIKELAFTTCLGIPWFLMCFNYSGFIWCLFYIAVLFLGISGSLNMCLPEELHRNVARNLQIQKWSSCNKEEIWRVGRNTFWVFSIYLFVACLDRCEDHVSGRVSQAEETGRGVWRRLEGGQEGRMRLGRDEVREDEEKGESETQRREEESGLRKSAVSFTLDDIQFLPFFHLERQSFSLKSHHCMLQPCQKQFFSFSIPFGMRC